MNKKREGSIVELNVMAKLLEYGEVSIPYGNNARYDCILDVNGNLVRVQIKKARRVDDNRFLIPFSNVVGGGKSKNKRKTYTKDEVDFIAAQYNGQVYLIHVGNLKNSMILSYSYPKNGIKKTINLEYKYRIENTITEITNHDTRK